MSIRKTIESGIARFERFQSRHFWLAYPIAVVKKFSDDQTGHYAALIAYYGFISIFPLLLVLVSLLELFFQNSHLWEQVLTYATDQFPALGHQLQTSVQNHTLHSETGLGLIVGIIVTLIGARGVAIIISSALNHVWRVPYNERPGFPLSWARQIGMIVVMGISIIGTTALVALGNWGVVIALIANVLAFLVVFRLGISDSIPTQKLIDSAVIAAVFWQILQALGTMLVKNHLSQANGVYGTFALVLGLLWWIWVQAQVTLLAVEIHVVRELKLWPRSLTEPPLMPGDERAYTTYAKGEKRHPAENIDVDFKQPE